MVIPHNSITVTAAKANYTNYNFFENSSTFRVQNIEIKGDDGFHERAQKCKIITINANSNRLESFYQKMAPAEISHRGKKKSGRGKTCE